MSEDLFGNVLATADAGVGSLSFADLPDQPLAVRMRPRSLDELVGQDHLLVPGSVLRRLAETTAPMSVFLWGPPGVGKTTIAAIVAQASQRRFVELSAVTAGVKEVRNELKTAKDELARGRQTVLFIDEVHRFSKAQQDVLLPAVENRLVTLIAATTENPSFSVISPLLSRSVLLTLNSLQDSHIEKVVDRALGDERGLAGRIELAPQAKTMLIRLSGGDARRSLTYLEEAAAGASAVASKTITVEILQASVDKAAVRYDRDGDQHYDVISAFIKSVRGSDVQAALHYLARMIEAGEDARFIARRLIVLASEDIGMASPTVLQLCVAAAQAVQLIGMPEGRITLAHATIAAAMAPKSNAVVLAVDSAISDLRAGKIGQVPAHLRDAHYQSAKKYGHGVGYKYAHDFPHGVAAQQYLPDELEGVRYYVPTDHGQEALVLERWATLQELLRTTAP
ncbi:MAG: replication-associated recombination protein A [Propionibacteriaceae bacterium]|jgi:putative ATPase|nr:replication-associated recombination protein A [Propionibacteriaceae bacterium]